MANETSYQPSPNLWETMPLMIVAGIGIFSYLSFFSVILSGLF